MSSAETVVIAGAGNIAQYLVEELIDDAQYRVAVISRSSRPSLDALGVDVRIVKEYSRESVLPILDSLPKTRALISTLSTDDPTVYTPLHEALLSACRDSKTCKHFIPSEFLGNTRDYETIPRGIYRARRDFRAILTSQKDVTFTFVNLGWLADYFVQAPGSHKTYIRPFPQGWPIDLEKRTVRVIGTGDEPIGWTATRDMARAVVALIPHDDWPEYIWVYGELGTWNQAIQKVEKFYGIELQREYVSKESISACLSNENEPDKWYSATIDEWSLVGATAVPRQEADQQREKYFKDVGFRDIEALLLSSQHVPVV